jgi:hypothetical protein
MLVNLEYTRALSHCPNNQPDGELGILRKQFMNIFNSENLSINMGSTILTHINESEDFLDK